MKKSTITIVIGLVLVAIIAGITLFSSSEPIDLLDANLQAEGDAPAVQVFANDFVRQLQDVSNSKVAYETIKETKKDVVLQNISLQLKEPKDKPTTLSITKASFTEDGTATLDRLLLSSDVPNEGKLGLGVREVTIQDYQKENGIVTSINQEFRGGIANGAAFDKIKTQYNTALKLLEDKPAAIKNVPGQIADGLVNMNGAAEYTYDQQQQALVTGLRVSMPSLLSARLSFAFDEVTEKAAKKMQDHVIFGSSLQSVMEQVEAGNFDGVLTKARLKLVDLGFMNKAIALIASLQKKGEPAMRAELKTMMNAYTVPPALPAPVQQTVSELRAALVGVIEGRYSTIVVNLLPKADAPKMTLQQAMNGKFATYDMAVAGE